MFRAWRGQIFVQGEETPSRPARCTARTLRAAMQYLPQLATAHGCMAAGICDVRVGGCTKACIITH